MKQKLFLSFITVAFGVLSSTAQNQENLVINAGNLEHIVIASDMNIILMPGTDIDKSISLNAKASGKLNLRVSDNSMTISPLRQSLKKERLTVYLHVNGLKTISVEDNTTIKTIGVLNTPKLDVYVDGRATVHLKTNGVIKAYPLDDEEIKIRYLSENLLAKRIVIGGK